jgi:regulator of protease activity HflC (stomatin/prohibitin superfamily)
MTVFGTVLTVILILAAVLLVALLALLALKSIQIIPQATARNVERLGRFRRTLEAGLTSSCRSWTRSRSL